MSIFVTGRVAITATGETPEHEITPTTDVIYIPTKMDTGKTAAVQNMGIKFVDNRPELQAGTWNLSLLQVNIVAWAGPSFADMQPTAALIAQLDPHAPIVVATLAAITRRNTAGATTDPNAATPRASVRGGDASPDTPSTPEPTTA